MSYLLKVLFISFTSTFLQVPVLFSWSNATRVEMTFTKVEVDIKAKIDDFTTI